MSIKDYPVFLKIRESYNIFVPKDAPGLIFRECLDFYEEYGIYF